MSAFLDNGIVAEPPKDRASERVELLIEAEGALEQGASSRVWVHNISSTGLQIECEIALKVGQYLRVALPEAGLVAANVIWGDAPLYGCRFEQPLSRAAVSAARLRNLMPHPEAQTVKAEPEVSANHGQPHMEMAARLRRIREEKGLSLAALSRQSGISKPSIWAWETGKTMPRPRSIDALAQALNLEPSILWGTENRDSVHGSDTGSIQSNGPLDQVVADARRRIASAAGVAVHQVKISLEL